MPNALKASPMKLVLVSFAMVILLGALLLCLPISTKDGSIAFIDALFTSTSATCVTGLVVFDTFSKFTFFGQLVILCLIQIGGLGFITIAMMVVVFSGKRIGLRSRTYLAEAVSSGQIGGVVRYAKMIMLGTLMIESIGAALLSIRFVPMFGLADGIWCGVFHAVSAFCNAGFDILGRIEPDTSLVHFSSDPYVIIIIASLIAIGGIGFFVWHDLRENGLHWKKYRLHTKLMLSGTIGIIVVGTVLFVITEYNAGYAHLGFGDKVLAGFFQSITTRTAGYFSVDQQTLSPAGFALSTVLMIIGAGAGSTGGGIKVTTFIVLALSVRSTATGCESMNAFGRRIDTETIKKVFCNTTIYLFLWVVGSYIIMATQGFEMSRVLFETASAIGTVGLTSGITTSLTVLSKMVEIFLMFSGRVGSMSVAMAISRRSKLSKIKFPEEKIMAG